jgi:hypothetical protein
MGDAAVSLVVEPGEAREVCPDGEMLRQLTPNEAPWSVEKTSSPCCHAEPLRQQGPSPSRLSRVPPP